MRFLIISFLKFLIDSVFAMNMLYCVLFMNCDLSLGGGDFSILNWVWVFLF